MKHTIENFTDQDLLGCIMSPHTTPEQKWAALKERAKRQNKLAILPV
jgi:hypothetical protein